MYTAKEVGLFFQARHKYIIYSIYLFSLPIQKHSSPVSLNNFICTEVL